MTTASEIRFLVKICGITDKEDAEAAVAAGANAIGYNFYARSSRYVTTERARELSKEVPGNYVRVGVFVNPSADELARALAQVPLDVVQLHGDACANPPQGTRVWRSVVLPASNLWRDEIEAYLLDSPAPEFGGSGKIFDWSLAVQFPFRSVLAGGLDERNVGEAIRIARPWGVDACSRLECAPGKKDRTRVQAFVRAAFREANAAMPVETTK